MIDQIPRRFEAHLFANNNYRGPPSRELDAAWDRFTTSSALAILFREQWLKLSVGWMGETAVILNVSAEEIRRSGNDFSMGTIVELDAPNGGGYMATLELFHQLHCLV